MALLIGIHAAEEAVQSTPERIERLCVQRGVKNPRVRKLVDICKVKGVPVSFEEKAWLDRKAGGERHQGVLCYAAEIRTWELEEIFDAASTPGLVLILDGLEDPHNLGAILRSAEAAGVDGVFLPLRRSVGLTPAAVKASAGAAVHVRVARMTNTTKLIERLKERGYWVTGLDPGAERTLWEVDLTGPSALVIGNEARGIHRLVKESCDFLASIPVRGKVASHNASVAAGIALYEAQRQRDSSGRRKPE